MNGIGSRRWRIAFYRDFTSENAMGEPVKAEHPLLLGKAMAEVFWGTGSERRAAAIEGASQSATFLVRSTRRTRAVTPRDFIRFEGSDWDIAGPPLRRDRRDLEFTATRRA